MLLVLLLARVLGVGLRVEAVLVRRVRRPLLAIAGAWIAPLALSLLLVLPLEQQHTHSSADGRAACVLAAAVAATAARRAGSKSGGGAQGAAGLVLLQLLFSSNVVKHLVLVPPCNSRSLLRSNGAASARVRSHAPRLQRLRPACGREDVRATVLNYGR